MDNLFERLTNLIDEYENVIIMGHYNPDLDSLGSCLGLSNILTDRDKENYVFIDVNNEDMPNSVKQAIPLVKNCNFIDESSYKKVLKDKTLLIVVDVHVLDRLEYPKLVDKVSGVVVLDHHIKSSNYIKDAEIFYIDSSLSCVVELIAFYARYLEFNISPVIASIMLAGMEIDTNGFNIRLSEHAFEGAAILVSMGADAIIKQNLLKESKRDFLKKADYIKSSYIYHKKYAICLLYTGISKPDELAEISEALLNFEDVEASFTIGQLCDRKVGISARSLGNIDVCDVMQQLGGGGHQNNAAVQLENTTIKAMEKSLKKVLGD